MSLYFKYFKVHFKCDLEYKFSFIMSFISQFFVFFSYYFTIICLFDKFSNIKGFTLYEVLLTFGVIQFGFSFCETFFRGIYTFDEDHVMYYYKYFVKRLALLNYLDYFNQ